jgi:hypothetical protein
MTLLCTLFSLVGIVLFAQQDLEKLSDKDFDKLKEGKVITNKRRKDGKIIVVAQGIVISDSRAIYDVIMNCDEHIDFMPNFKACESIYEYGDSAYGKTIIDPPLTKKDIAFYLFSKYMYSKSYSKISWKMDTSQVHPNYIADTFGFWEIQEIEPDEHLLSFYSNSDFNFHWTVNWLLEPIFKMFMKNGLPNLVKNVRARVESDQSWVMKDPHPSPKIALRYNSDH